MVADVVGIFLKLFAGNRNAVGVEEGGCQRIPPEEWDLYVEAHLRGADVTLGGPGPQGPIGVYPMVYTGIADHDEGWKVHWGCIDFDEGEEESWAHAKNVHQVLQQLGVVGWIERSRSKGYHVWVFADAWVPAKLMREALLAACELVDAPTKEVNPKQVELKEGQLGNYVRLPYPGALAFDGGPGYGHATARRMMWQSPLGDPLSVSDFVSRAYSSRVGIDTLKELAGRYVAPEPPIKRRQWVKLRGKAIDRLGGAARMIFEQGPLEGGDRSETLWKLARYLREDNRHTREEALVLLQDADFRWGKFHARPDVEKRLQELVNKAWDNPT